MKERDLFDFRWKALRPGQRAGLDVLFKRCIARESYTALVVPTRYGKTDLQRVAGVQLHKHGIVSATLALSPGLILRDQCDAREKWTECIDRYSLPTNLLRRRIVKLETNYTANGEVFLSATIQLVCRNVDHFCDWVESQCATTGKPPLIFIDECHTASLANLWGTAGKRLADSGALICLLTGTAIRDDNVPILGFDLETVELGGGVQTKITRGSSPDLYRVTKYAGTWKETRLQAHHETPYSAAWDEIPPPLCNFSHNPFEVRLSDVDLADPDAAELCLSELSEHKTRLYLGRICRDPIVIREGVRRFVEKLRSWKRVNQNIGGIIFCGNDGVEDQDPAANAHARRIRSAIETEAGGESLEVVIATSADLENENDKGAQKIHDFKYGKGDVLIVKQMGGVGFDCPRLKVLLDLSPVRGYASWVQRVMRIATPYEGITNCTLIHPADCLAQRIWMTAIEAEGGEADALKAFDIESVISSYEKSREESDSEPDLLSITGTEGADFDDNRQNLASSELQEYVRGLIDEFPVLSMHHTDAEIAKRTGHLLAKVQSGSKPLPDLEGNIRTVKDTINELAKEIAIARLGGYDRKSIGEAIREVFNEAYRTVGISSIGGVSDLGVLQRVKTELQRVALSQQKRRSA